MTKELLKKFLEKLKAHADEKNDAKLKEIVSAYEVQETDEEDDEGGGGNHPIEPPGKP